MKEALQKIAVKIEGGCLPKETRPLVFAVTGTGRVSQGILEVLEVFPHVKVQPSQLKEYVEAERKKEKPEQQIIISIFSAKDLVRPKSSELAAKDFDKAHYYKNPHLYENKFHEQLPYVNFLIAGMYWEQKYPRILTEAELKSAQLENKSALMGVCDISADYEGCIEFTKRFTSIDEPFLVYDGQK
mmetsp:Transcript_14194/g.24130  ORF Transcript_14194/g.24130 Transcript_14194/m.24130 type:complete len:186 (-) Transcript_14194:739-1296(-)